MYLIEKLMVFLGVYSIKDHRDEMSIPFTPSVTIPVCHRLGPKLKTMHT